MIVLVVLPFTWRPGAVAAQNCTHYLNATDGSDQSSGASASQAVQTFEHAFKTFSTGAVVCTTAGEYFQGADADGIQLTGPSADGKSMTFVLQSFAGNNVVGLTEDEFVVDIGSGTITFQAGSASDLFLGPGSVNNAADFPGNTHFLHTINLLSGTVDAADVHLIVGPSAGNPSFEQGATSAPENAAIIRDHGVLQGSPQYADAFRRVRYVGQGDREAGPEISGMDRLELSFEHTAGTIAFPQQLSFVEGGIYSTGGGAVRFEENVTFNDPAGTTITSSGNGSLYFRSVTEIVGANLQLVDVQQGSVEIDHLLIGVSDDASDVDVSASNRERFVLHSILTPVNTGGESARLNLINHGDAVLSLAATGGLSEFAAGVENMRDGTVRLSGGSTHVSGDVFNEGRLEIESGAVLNGSLLNSGGIQILSSAEGANAVSIDGALVNDGSVSLNSHELHVTSAGPHSHTGEINGGTLVLAGDANISGNGILPFVEARTGSSVLGAQHIDGGIGCLPGAGLHLDQISAIHGTVTVNCSLSHAGPLEIGGDLILESGLFALSDNIHVLGNFHQIPNATLLIGSSTLSVGGQFSRVGGTVQIDGGTLAFVGDGMQSVEAGSNLTLHDLSISGPNTRIAVGSEVDLTGDLTINSNAQLDIDGELRLVGANSAARIAGRAVTGTASSLAFAGESGSQQVIEGGGLIGDLLVALDDENDTLTIQGDGIRQSGTLTIERGSMVAASAVSLILSSELGTPRIRRNLGDDDSSGTVDGRAIIANVPGAGTMEAPDGIDVDYFGAISGTVEAGGELSTWDVRDLAIDLEPLVGSHATFHIPYNVIIEGSLGIGVTTNVEISDYSITTRGDESIHVIDGTMASGALVIEGTGTLKGTPQSRQWLDELTIRSPGVVNIEAGGSIRLLSLEQGDLSIQIPEGESVGTFHQTGLDSQIQLRKQLHVSEELRIDVGSIAAGPFDVVMESGSALSVSPDVHWSTDATGFVIFAGTSEVGSGESLLPRLRLAGEASDTLRLAGDLRIASTFEHESGTLDLGVHILTLAGREWKVNNGSYAGTGAIRLPTSMNAELRKDIRVPSLSVGDPNDPTEFTVRSSGETSVALAADTVRLLGGMVDLGGNDLLMTGSAPLLISSEASIQGVSESSTDTVDRGEIVFEEGGTIHLNGNLSASALRLHANVAMTGAPNTLTIVNRITFEAGNLAGLDGQFIMDDDATLVRNGQGRPLITPVVDGLINVQYVTDGRAISGLLETGPELPNEIGELIIDGGIGPSGEVNTIRLTDDVRVSRRLSHVSGMLDDAEHTILIAQGGEIRLDYRGEMPPTFADSTSYVTEGPITLSYFGGSGDVSSNNLMFPREASVGELIVRMGDKASESPGRFQLHAFRRIGRLTVDHFTEDSSLDIHGTTLIVDSTAHVAAGRLTAGVEGILEVGGDFLLDDSASVDGVVSVTVDGTAMIDGTFQGHILRAVGDVRVTGVLGGPDRMLDADAAHYVPGTPNLILAGTFQTLDISPADAGSSRLDDSINLLRLALKPAAEGADEPSVSIVSDHSEGIVLGVNNIEFENGLIASSNNVIVLPSNGRGFSRTAADIVSHVVGPVRRLIDAGQPGPTNPQGRFEFPIGSNYPFAVYRPAALLFKDNAPAMAPLDVTISHVDEPPGGMRGFPVYGGNDILIDDTAPFHWVVRSASDFPPGQVFSLEFLAPNFSQYSSPERVRLIRHNVSRSNERWRLHAGPSVYQNTLILEGDSSSMLIKTEPIADGLSADSTIFSVGLEPQDFDFARVQFIHDAPAGVVTVHINDQAIFNDLHPQTGTPFLRLPPGEHELRFESNGIDALAERFEVSAGNDFIVIASGRGGVLPEGTFVNENARATVERGIDDDAQVTLYNGYDSSLDITFLQGSSSETSYSGIPSGGFLPSYVTVPPGILDFDIQTTGHAVSYQADLQTIEGLTAVALVAAATEEAIVISSEGKLLGSDKNVSRERVPTSPDRFSLHGNFPNPFNPTTYITFDLPDASTVHIEVFDIVGRRVLSSDKRSFGAGKNLSMEVDAGRLPSGVYLYRVVAATKTSSYSGSGRFTLVK